MQALILRMMRARVLEDLDLSRRPNSKNLASRMATLSTLRDRNLSAPVGQTWAFFLAHTHRPS